MNKFLLRIVSITILVFFTFEITSEASSTEWNVSLWSKRRAFTEHVEKLAELVSKKTNGSFKLNISYGGLSKSRDNLDGIAIGAFEMAQFCAGYHADKNPSITVLELPFLGVSSLEQERLISQELYRHPAVKADLARWNATLLMPSPLPQYNIVGVGTPPYSLQSYDGLSVRATGGIGRALKALNAVPTSVTAPEVRQAMDSGVVKSVAFAPHAHIAFGTVESAKWWTTNLNPGTVNCPVVVNTDALNSLSKSEKQALLSSVDEALDHYIKNYNENVLTSWQKILKDKNITLVTYSESELSTFRKTVALPAAQEWITENTKKGLPAQELYDFAKKLISKYSK